MTLELKGILFLIAAILFGVSFVLGWAGEPYGAYNPRIHALAWCLCAIAWTLWAGGK
jgi:hypothetical protein